jgi:hypothetical protein
MGVQMWYDGNDPAGNGLAINDGTVITSWKDKSGNGFHATVSGSPTLNRNVANNKSAMLFNRSSLGTATYLLSPNTFQTAFQVFVVSKSVNAIDNGANTPITLGSTSQFDPWNASRYLSNGQAICQSPNSLYNTNLNLFGALVFQGSGSYYTEWRNGVLVPSTSLTGTKSGFSAVTNTNNFYIGGRQDRNTSWDGYIYEIAVYNSVLSTTDRQAIEGYLAWKWGFQTSLSVSHPYYSVAPIFTGLTNPPFKPTGVSAVNSAAGLVVSWSGGAGAMSYVIRVSGTLEYSITLNGSNLYTGTVPQVAIGTSYTVNVRATNAYGSTMSDTIVITIPNVQVSTAAGTPGMGVSRIDGVNEGAFIYRPVAIVSNSCGSSIYALDVNHYVREIFLQNETSGAVTSMVTTYSGTGAPGPAVYTETDRTTTAFNYPMGLAIDSAVNLYVADTYNHCIRKITPQGNVVHLAGSNGAGYSDSIGNSASFRFPKNIAVDSAGNLYVADANNHCIRKITAAGVVSTLAGAAVSGTSDGVGINARFNEPWGITIDSLGNLYIADTYNHSIRKVTPTGVVTTVAGLKGTLGFVDGVGSCARFNYPYSIAVDTNGSLYVADTGNHAIRQVVLNSAGSGSASATCAVTNQDIATVTTLAGTGTAGYTNGAGSSSQFRWPYGICVDPTGIIYVADTYNNTIRKITVLPSQSRSQSSSCATLCRPCCWKTFSSPGSSSCNLYPAYIMNASGYFVGLSRGFYQNGVNSNWANLFSQTFTGLTANTLTGVGNFSDCTLHLLPGWIAFGYYNSTPSMNLDLTPYTGSSTVRRIDTTLTYILIIVNQNEITYQNAVSNKGNFSQPVLRSGSSSPIPFPRSLVPTSIPANVSQPQCIFYSSTGQCISYGPSFYSCDAGRILVGTNCVLIQ